MECSVVSGVTLSGQILTENPQNEAGNHAPNVYYCAECGYCYASGDDALITYLKQNTTKSSFDCLTGLKECVELEQITSAQGMSIMLSYFEGRRSLEEIQILIREMFIAAGKPLVF